jgi:glycosyltransferase involved in cell wall biosynthesis
VNRKAQPRVALFTDAFTEVNGLALTSRHIDRIAGERGLPLLIVHAGETTSRSVIGSRVHVQLARGRAAIRVERDLGFDPLLWRHRAFVKEALEEFQPDVAHVTGPGDVGLFGLYMGHRLGLPLLASWHTNVHEYASWRMARQAGFLPGNVGRFFGGLAQRAALYGLKKYYGVAQVSMAPNEELASLLRAMTGRPAHIMIRGVDTALFSPRRRVEGNGVCTLGFVGRLSPEKNLRSLVALETRLRQLIRAPFRFLIVGDGVERSWLEANLRSAEFTGVLGGEALARAYARMDVFVFPSETETFGNVVLEALASGVPAVVTSKGGPQFIIEQSSSGFCAADSRECALYVSRLIADSELRKRMGEAARARSEQWSWEAMMDAMYRAYRQAIDLAPRPSSFAARPAGHCQPVEQR